jgi:hypothetical protein
MLQDQQYQLTAQAGCFNNIFKKKRKFIANARSVKNALDRARMRQADQF